MARGATDWDSWMGRLLIQASHLGTLALREVPVCAVVIDTQGRCIGRGSNCREVDHDPFGHAEIIALRQAARLQGDWRFNNCTLIVTLEPCPMCAGALVQARMGRVVFGASDPKRGALGGTINLAEHKSAHHCMQVLPGVCEEEAQQQLKSWFKNKRRQRPYGSWEAPSRKD